MSLYCAEPFLDLNQTWYTDTPQLSRCFTRYNFWCLKRPALHKGLLCTGAFLYAPYSFLLISKKFWMGGSSAVMLLNHTSDVMLLNQTRGVVWALKPLMGSCT
jgi:hypothetical protein